MAIVGTAYVRLRVIGDKLKGDIAKATENAVNQSAPNLAHSGEEIGEKISDGVGDSLHRSVGGKMGRVADDIGDAIGHRMAENMGRSLRRRAGSALSNGLRNVRVRSNEIVAPFRTAFNKFQEESKKAGKKSGVGLKNALFAAIALAVTAGPSIIAFTGAVGGALVSTLVPAIASIGPAAAGAGLAFVAAFSSMKISTGLFGIAMKTETAALKDFQKRATEFKANIGRPIQAGMLSGFNAAMRISTPLVAAMQSELKEFGTILGDVAIGLADTFRQGPQMERMSRILTANNDAIKIAGPAVSNLAVAFSILLDHLSPITLFLATLVRDVGAWAEKTLTAAEASGQLDAFITRMFNSLRYFVGILVDFGIGVWNVFRAAYGASGGMLTNLHDMAASFREWTGSEEGQARMTRFFENMRVIAGRVLEIFGQMAGAGGRALEGTNVDSVLRGLNTLVSVGQAVGEMFEQIRAAAGPGLADAFTAFAQMITALANSGVIGILTTAFTNLFRIISFVLNIPGVGQLLAFIAGLAALMKTVSLVIGVLKMLRPAIMLIVRVLTVLAGVVGWVPLLIGALVAALIWFFTQTEIGRDIIAAVWDFIKNAISAAVDWIVGAWNTMVEALKSAWDWVVKIAGWIWAAIKFYFTTIFNFYVMIWTAIYNAISTALTAIWDFIQPIIQGIWSFIQTAFGAIRTVIETILNIIYQIWIRVWPLLALPVRILYGVIILIWNAIYGFLSTVITAIWNFIVGAWNAITGAITTAVTAIWNIIQSIWNAIWGFLQPIIQGIWDFIVNTWNTIYNAVAGAVNRIWTRIQIIWMYIQFYIQAALAAIKERISTVWNAIYGAVSGVVNKISNVIRSIWNGITGFIRGAMDTIGDIIGDAWDFIAGVGESVLDGIKAAINTVIGVINTIIDGINWAIDLANHLPGPDIPNIPAIPRLAQGGVVSPAGGGTLAMIAEAGRSERVEPLDAFGLSTRDRALIRELSGSGNANVHVYIGTRELTELVDIVVEEREDDLSDRVLTGTKA